MPTLEEKRAQVQCVDYKPLPGKVRCQHYTDAHTCTKPEYIMCIEWLRQNPGAVPVRSETEATQERSLKILPLPGPAKAHAEPDEPTMAPPTKSGSKDAYVLPKVGTGPNLLVSHPDLISEAAITELEALGYEVELTMPDGKSVFLVPAYTRTGRTELTFKDARTLLLVLQVFPGTRLVKINSKSGLKAAGGEKRS